MVKLTLERASAIVEGALAWGRANRCEPLTVTVLDAGGHLVAFKREDESGILRPEIAAGKAYGALGFGVSSRAIAEKNPEFLAAVSAASQGRMVPVPGGVLLRDPETSDILGAVGISGDTSSNDEAAAVAGIDAADLDADTGG